MPEVNDAPQRDDSETAGQPRVEIELPESERNQEPLDEVTQLRLQLQEAQDRVLRSQAELENFRRRIRREMEEERRYATQPLLTDLFPVMDNIDRAIQAATQSQDASGLLEGFQMVAGQLSETLKKHGCTRIEAVGQSFDPALHEAISQMPSDEHPEGTVSHLALEGYQLHDRVVRPAQVVVSAGGSANKKDSEA